MTAALSARELSADAATNSRLPAFESSSLSPEESTRHQASCLHTTRAQSSTEG